MRRKYPLIVIVFFLFFGTCFGSKVFINHKELSRDKVTVLSKGNQKIVFYKDDCSDCKKVYSHYFWHDFFFRDVQFVNLNNSENRRYINEFSLRSVPTIVYKGRQYTGTSKKKIDEILSQ